MNVAALHAGLCDSIRVQRVMMPGTIILPLKVPENRTF